MTHDDAHHSRPTTAQSTFWTSRAFLVFLGFAAIALVLLWEEHRAHILGALPYLLLLACPLMHVFMHGGHGGHGYRRGSERYRDTGPPDGGAS